MLEKIKPLEEMTEISRRLKAEGKKIVLSHGVFDIIHVGHKRHLQFGKHQADIQIVTLTCDKSVNKGPGRPIFTEDLRAEMLASLEYVDFVVINPMPSAENLIAAFKPDIYLKGIEYEKAAEDVTGKIVTERMAVSKIGGEIRYSNELTFSSSNIANRALRIYPEEAQIWLESVRTRLHMDTIKDCFRKVKKINALVIGETIIDEYIYVSPLGTPSKENILATKYQESEVFVGGAAATANLVSEFVNAVDFITVTGSKSEYREMIKVNLNEKINLLEIKRPSVMTRKTRFVEQHFIKKQFEIAYLDDSPLDPEKASWLEEAVFRQLSKYDVVIVNDFGHGMISADFARKLSAADCYLCVNAQTNSANRGFNLITKYPAANLICIDAPEARLAVMNKEKTIEDVATLLRRKVACEDLIITNGNLGAISSDKEGNIDRMPALTNHAVDSMGAGDAYFATASSLMGGGGSLFIASFVSNAVGAMAVKVVGHRNRITFSSVFKYLTALLK